MSNRTVSERPVGAAWVEFFRVLRRHPDLAWELSKRELTDKHAGQALGRVWPFVHPLLLIGIYLFVFGYVFRVRTGAGDGTTDTVLYLLAGLIPWLTVADTVTKGTSVLVSNTNLVKQVVFPLEILTAKTVFGTVAVQLLYLIVLTIYVLLTTGGLPWTVALVPLLVVFQTIGLFGLVSILAAAGAFFRDLKEAAQIFSALGLYLMPVVYPKEMLTGTLGKLLYANPFSYLVWCYQDAWASGQITHPEAWIVFPILCLLTFAVGTYFFRHVKQFLGGVL